MRKLFVLALATIILTSAAMFPADSNAASSMSVSVVAADGGINNDPEWPNRIVVAISMTAHTDGTFTSYQITTSDIPSRKLGTIQNVEYYNAGYVISHAYAVNPASGYPTSAGVVTVSDSTGNKLIGNAGSYLDALTVSTSASGIGELSIERGSGQRAVTSALTIACTNVGASKVFTLYLVFKRA